MRGWLIALIILLLLATPYCVYGLQLSSRSPPSNAFFDVREDQPELTDAVQSRWSHTPQEWRSDVRTIVGLEPVMDLRPNDAVFEVGCGTGAFLDALLEIEPSLVLSGNDINASALSRCRAKHPSAVFYQADLLDASIPSPPNPVDHVVGNGVLVYMQSLDAVRRTLERCDTMLRSGGTMRFTMIDPPITLWQFLTFRVGSTSGRLRIPESLFREFAERHGYSVRVHRTSIMHGDERYIVAMRKG